MYFRLRIAAKMMKVCIDARPTRIRNTAEKKLDKAVASVPMAACSVNL